MFEDYKVGDKVWKYGVGWIEITEINNEWAYPISCSDGYTYSMDGKLHVNNYFPSIFPNKFKIPQKAFIKPLPKLKVDTKVLVWDDGVVVKEKRHFSHFNKYGKIVCFDNGTTSWSNYNDYKYTWDNWELYIEEDKND